MNPYWKNFGIKVFEYLLKRLIFVCILWMHPLQTVYWTNYWRNAKTSWRRSEREGKRRKKKETSSLLNVQIIIHFISTPSLSVTGKYQKRIYGKKTMAIKKIRPFIRCFWGHLSYTHLQNKHLKLLAVARKNNNRLVDCFCGFRLW